MKSEMESGRPVERLLQWSSIPIYDSAGVVDG